jgi:hypothetical protein
VRDKLILGASTDTFGIDTCSAAWYFSLQLMTSRMQHLFGALRVRCRGGRYFSPLFIKDRLRAVLDQLRRSIGYLNDSHG